MAAATTKDPNENWTLEQWKAWVHDHVDLYFGTIELNAEVLLAIVSQRDSALDQVERVQKAWDEERQRL
jgi:hypothetical protein